MKFIINPHGYTLVELLLSISILAGIFLIVSDFYANELIAYNRNFTQTIIQSNIKQAIETVEKDVRQSTRVEDTNTFADPNRPGGWASSTGTPATLIVAEPAVDSSGNVIFADPTHTSIKTDDLVFFVGTDNSLYRRVLANPDPVNRSKTTCPAALSSASCPPDGKIIENIASISVAYFDTTNTSIASAPFVSAYSIQTTMTQNVKAFGKIYTGSLTSQASMRNR